MTTTIENFKEHEDLFKKQTGLDFNYAYNKYYTKLVYYISKRCPDIQQAEDLSTKSFIRSIEKIDQFDKTKAQFSTWLFRIGRNIAYKEMDDNKHISSIDVEYDKQGTTMKEFIPNSEEDEVEDLIIKKGRIMLEHISKLREPYRRVIEMRELDNLSYQEISEILGENLNTIKSRIKNGRILLINSTKKEFKLLDK